MGPCHHGTSSRAVATPITSRLFHHGFAVKLWDKNCVIVVFVAEERGALAMLATNDEMDALQETKSDFAEPSAFFISG